MTARLLTEIEAAQILRCSTSKIKRLRLSGRLAYIAGRPVLISETDLDAFVEAQTHRVSRPTSAAAPGAAVEDARKWALKAVLLKRRC
jgi:excisionase family DNA binding protein